MYEELKNKKLLILGATSNETTLVKRAQDMGLYVIVTDYHEDWSMSPAKKIANEAWNISWADIDVLEKKCIERKIDGITAGYSEFRVENLIKLCQRLNLPCYISEEQLEITRDKKKFKKKCKENGIPTVKEYYNVNEVDEFPVIVKPVDRAGSIGISIANNVSELHRAFQYAMENSVSKEVIIERYMQQKKIDVYYAVEDEEITLISSCDTIQASNNGLEKVCQSAWLYPMAEIDSYLKKIDSNARKMIHNMGIKYGCIFFSGFVNQKKDFVFFECGFRLEGAHQYNYTELRGPYNYLDLFIIHAMTGKTELLNHNSINNKLKCAVINIYVNEGIIGKIEGQEEIEKLKDCTLVLTHGKEGEFCSSDRAILTKIMNINYTNEDSEELARDIEFGYKKIHVLDENGFDMIFDRINPNVVATWWN